MARPSSRRALVVVLAGWNLNVRACMAGCLLPLRFGNWLQIPRMGRPIEGTAMIPFKPPLKAELNELLDDEHRFSIQMFMERQVHAVRTPKRGLPFRSEPTACLATRAAPRKSRRGAGHRPGIPSAGPPPR